jgi:trk system potassium uptake protein TrkA
VSDRKRKRASPADRQAKPTMAGRRAMRVIIVGGGHIGFALARVLAPRHSVFVIDHDAGVADAFAKLDVQFVHGSATSATVLRRAQADQADIFISCTGLDEVNIVSCSLARSLGDMKTVCFVSKDDLLRFAGTSDGLQAHFKINQIVWPEAQLAADIERIVAVPGAIDAETFADGRIQLVEYRLRHGSPLTTGPIAGLHLPHGTLIVAVKQGQRFFIPHGATRLSPDDKIVVMGTADGMRRFHERVVGEQPRRAKMLVTIVGGGDVGFRLAQGLDRQRDVELRVIESSPARGEFVAANLQRALVLTGDGTDLELLESEQIGRSDVLVSVIDNDERNLLASLLGRQLGVGKVITRVSKPANLRLFERVGIDVAISARGAAVAAVVHQIEGGKTNLLAVLEEGEAKVLEIEVPVGYASTALRDLRAPAESIVGAILRGKEALVPRGDDVVRPGDRLVVFAGRSSADQVRDYFASVR